MRVKIIGMAWLLVAGAWGQAAIPAAQTAEFAVVAGTDAESQIAYALISLDGKVVGAGATPPQPPPRLTAQCTKTAAGKFRFELLADAGGVATLAFYPPWKQSATSMFRPPEEGVVVTMEFLGYMKMKPVKRAWRYLNELPGEMRYDSPSLRSANMEEVTFYLQYLKALPTLRLTIPGRGKPPVTAEFETAKWQGKVKAEPLCWASSL